MTMREITIRVPDFTLRNMVLFMLLLGGGSVHLVLQGPHRRARTCPRGKQERPWGNRRAHSRSVA